MTCHSICSLLNDDICMNLCVLSLDPRRFYTLSVGEWCYVLHSSMEKPIARISVLNQLKIEEIHNYIVSKKGNK